jgi:hypothetical protein
MKKLIPFILILLVTSCQEPNVESKKTEYTIETSLGTSRLEIIEVEGCEYLYGPWGNATVLVHKGNCKNRIHPEHTRK